MDDVLFGNVMPTPVAPPSTGHADADAAIAALQGFPMSPHTPFPRPSGPEYDALLARAAQAPAERLVALLDDAAVATGESHWSDAHVKSLDTKQRRVFKKHYEAVLAAVAVRKAYLHWLVSAVCTTPAGFERALQVVVDGTNDARQTAASAMLDEVQRPEDQRRLAEALDLRRWGGLEPELERTYRAGVVLACRLDPAETFDRYAELLTPSALQTEAGRGRAQPLLFGLLNAGNPDPRWTAPLLAMLPGDVPLAMQALMVLEILPPDPSMVEPLCAYLPAPDAKGGYWHASAVKVLAKVGDPRATPWLVAALRSSWMHWVAVFEGFGRIGDPALAHVVRDWVAANSAPDREAAAATLIAQLEKDGAVPRPEVDPLASEPPPPRARATLTFEEVAPDDEPTLDPLEKVVAAYRDAFEAAGIGDAYEALVRPAVWLLPRRVDESTLAPGGTKLGGHPDLPKNKAWPRAAKEPMTFLAQIALQEVAPHLPEGTLPTAGLLSFFMGDDPEGAAGYCEVAKVIYTPPGTPLQRREVPKDMYSRIYQAATVRMHATVRIPAPTHPRVTRRLKGDALEAYESQVFDDTVPILPQLLGYRDHGYEASQPATAEMLLQLPGDFQTEMEFGDAEVLGLYIHTRKLAAGDFKKVWPYVGD